MSRNNPHRYVHLVSFAMTHPWAVVPGMLHIIAGILVDRSLGRDPDPATVAAAVASRPPDPQPRRGSVALIPVHGVIAPRGNFMTEASGGTSFDALTRAVNGAGADPTIDTIVLDIDSPGGSVAGAAEFAATLRAVRARKPIVAQGNFTVASAAYWLAANATKIHASPSSEVGSIGVYTIHHDISAALDANGVKRTFISEGKYKLDGHDGAPLSEDAAAYLQAKVGKSYDRMIGDIAKGRGVPVATVRAGFGEGRLVGADDALALGMIDKVATLDETLDRLLPAGTSLSFAARATADTPQEPATATGQDRGGDVDWRSRIERDLLATSIAALS